MRVFAACLRDLADGKRKSGKQWVFVVVNFELTTIHGNQLVYYICLCWSIKIYAKTQYTYWSNAETAKWCWPKFDDTHSQPLDVRYFCTSVEYLLDSFASFTIYFRWWCICTKKIDFFLFFEIEIGKLLMLTESLFTADCIDINFPLSWIFRKIHKMLASPKRLV